MPILGLDSFITDLGVAEEKTCRVCGTICEAERSVYGPISFAGWAETQHRYHDRFVCPNAHKSWHQQTLCRTQATTTYGLNV
jgi:hypothetical protein